ncbi:hypothetical protein B0G62_11549 [Paraburkholderia eburnea]|uniref:Uncharacterized protein n=2 Tax=Paraburkholderia eburnea TaxID=1189126 RepID=A0A2S4M0P2_9BURK|nr:hypothetical protein B0G62_11549 [Paraburkholderia eburnea]PRZ22248.1 hypothetical protein BX588_10789 [Paraburkholderia eburnea]
MAQRNDTNFFDRLIAPMLKHLRQIAGMTRGEQSVDDLKSHAWIIAEEIKSERGADIEPDDEEVQATIVARLHRLFGHFVNRAMRFAIRLDQEERDNDGDFRENAVSARLMASRSYEPEVSLQRAEEAAEAARMIQAQFSEAVAYYHVFDQFDGDSNALARYFAIQSATLDARLARAEATARRQPSVFDGVESISPDFRPLRGRRRRRCVPARFRRVCGSLRPAQTHLFLRYGAVFK